MINIVGLRNVWFVFSGLLVTAAIVSLAVFGLNFGIDFTGGSFMEIQITEEVPTTEDVRAFIESQGIEGPRVQPSDDGHFLIRMPSLTEVEHQDILAAVTTEFGSVEELRFDMVGPVIGDELKRKAAWSVVFLLFLIVLYVAYAFRKVSDPVQSWKYGMLTIVAAAHDIIIPLGAFALFGHFLGFQIDAAYVAAMLTILGYSINDTIVVFDRVRENLLDRSSADAFEDVVNRSVNQTLARSINTSITTLLALVAVLIFGGDTTRQFVLALIIGISSGAYSSIFLASPLLVVWEKLKK